MPPPDWIDSHNHLHDQRLRPSRSDWWPEMIDSGVTAAIVNGTSPEDWAAVAGLRRDNPDFVFASYGLHPWHVPAAPADWQDQLLRLLDREPAVGIGEIGLDNWIRNADLPLQKDAFILQWRVAFERDLPVTVHCLQAWGHLLELVRQLPELKRGFLLHSFAGPAEMVADFVELGAHFSFSGHFMHQRKQATAELFRDTIPIDRLHVETDAPDMPPPQTEGVRLIPSPDTAINRPLNHPANLAVIGRHLARLRGVPEPEIAGQCVANTRHLFDLP